VPCLRPALVHGDFHSYNILLCNDGSAKAVRQQLPYAESRKLKSLAVPIRDQYRHSVELHRHDLLRCMLNGLTRATHDKA
jgi:RIO-like serine/threonine protein kinase